MTAAEYTIGTESPVSCKAQHSVSLLCVVFGQVRVCSRSILWRDVLIVDQDGVGAGQCDVTCDIPGQHSQWICLNALLAVTSDCDCPRILWVSSLIEE